jgi:hypothetical protein
MKTTLATGKTIIGAVVSEEQREQLIRLAKDADRSLSAEVRRAVVRYFARPDVEEPAS